MKGTTTAYVTGKQSQDDKYCDASKSYKEKLSEKSTQPFTAREKSRRRKLLLSLIKAAEIRAISKTEKI